MILSISMIKAHLGKAKIIAFAGVALATAMCGKSMAQGNLLVTPRRLIFEKAPNVRELNLANIGNDTAKFLISLMEIRMKEDGSFEQISTADSGQQLASPNLRIYPRSVTIPPGGSQVVKVQVIKPSELNPGEYRSHVYVRAVPVEKPLGEPASDQKPTDISVKLTAIFGVSIPALIRVGENDTKITITDPAFVMMDDKSPKLNLTLTRSGKMSSYGDITVECISADGVTTEVGVVRGIAVYTPNTKRRVQLDLNNTNKVNYHNSKLRIVYKTQKDASSQDFAETELALQ